MTTFRCYGRPLPLGEVARLDGYAIERFAMPVTGIIFRLLALALLLFGFGVGALALLRA